MYKKQRLAKTKKKELKNENESWTVETLFFLITAFNHCIMLKILHKNDVKKIEFHSVAV